MKRLRVVASALAAGLFLGACGSSGPTPPQEGPVTSSARPGSTAGTPTSPGAPPPGTAGPGGTPADPGTSTRGPATPSAGTTTLTGTVRAGVEANCLLLAGHLLLGGPPDVLVPGARVTVTGEVRADLMTTCQQGTPFQVRSATRS